MKKIFSTVCIILCLLFSTAATAVRADDGDGHDPGYVCVETTSTDCPPNDAPQGQGENTSGSNGETEDSTAENLSSILLELVNVLLP